MKITFKEVQGHFADAKFSPKHELLLSDARIGKYCYIATRTKTGGVNKLTDLYTFGEMVAFLTGLKTTKSKLA